MKIGPFEGKEFRKGIWRFDIPQFIDGVPNPDWYEFRKHTIGGSETSIVLGKHEPYMWPQPKLFWSKIGKDFEDINHEFGFWGHVHEENIAKMWKYWGEDTNYMDNMRNGNVKRKFRRIKSYLVNEKYPWLSCSLDFWGNANQVSPFTNKVIPYPFPLETKTMNSFVANTYEYGYPEQHLIQIHTQMLITESKYCEFAILVDGNNLEVQPADYQEVIGNHIIEKTKSFWYDRVVPGKELYKEYTESYSEEVDAKIQLLEPDIEYSDSQQKFLKEHHRESYADKVMQGTDELMIVAQKYAEGSQIEKQGKEMKLNAQIDLQNTMGNHERIVFEDDSQVDWRRSKGTRTYWKVNLKQPKEETEKQES